MSMIIKVTLFDEQTKIVTETLIQVYNGQYGYEVEDMFYKLGEAIAKKVDPSHGAEYPQPEEL